MQVPGYRLGRELGRGAQGRVVEATHVATGVRVALKQVAFGGPRELRALETEVLAMARLNHPHLLALYDYGLLSDAPSQGGLWMATELASGGTLEGWIPARYDQLVEVLEPLLAGLAHAHARGMVHRDLKPANLLRATPADLRPGLKIGDFGLTTLHGVEAVYRRGGTPTYMPPEQARADAGELGPWSDVYALGAMLWRWVCGGPLFDGTPAEVVQKHLTAPVPPFTPTLALPPTVEPLLRRMLAKRTGDRPHDVAEVREALLGRPADVFAAVARVPAGVAPLPGIGASLWPLREWRMVGRHAEREALVARLAEVVEGRRPAVHVVTGAPGVGASRLVRWLAETAAEAGVARVVQRATDLGEALALARHGPVVVVFDPLDAAGEALLASLAFSGAPVLGLATTRRLRDWPDLDLLPGFGTTTLGPLPAAELRQLLHLELGLSETLTVRMDAACAYDPGVAIAWMTELARRDLLAPGTEGWEVGHHLPPPPPRRDDPELAELERWVPSLAPHRRRALRAAALLGDHVEHGTWTAMANAMGLDPDELPLRGLVERGLVRLDDRGFRWQGVREALLSPPPLPHEHLAAAHALATLPPTPSRRLEHARRLLAAGAPAEARAVALVHAHAARPDEQEVLRQTVEAIRPHLEGATPNEQLTFALMELRVVLNLVSGKAALPLADRLLAMAGDPETARPHLDPTVRREAFEFVARVYAFETQPLKALRLLARLPVTSVTLRCQALLHVDHGELDAAIPLFQRSLAATADDEEWARVANGLGIALARSARFDEAATWFARAAERIDPGTAYVPLGNLAQTLLVLGRPAEALAPARAAWTSARSQPAQRLATAVILFALAAALADDEALDGLADQALYSLRRFGLADLHLLRPALTAARPSRAAGRAMVTAVLAVLGPG